MKLRLIAVGSRMPRWVEEGWQEYVKRLPTELSLELVEIPLHTRGKNADVARLIRQEGEAMLAKVADTYDEQVETSVTRLTALLEPLLIMFMVGIVLVIIFATLAPLLQITSSLQQ